MIDWTRPDRLFPHHQPTQAQIQLIEPVRLRFEELAWDLRDMVPPGADRTAAERALHAAQQAYIVALVAPAPSQVPEPRSSGHFVHDTRGHAGRDAQEADQ